MRSYISEYMTEMEFDPRERVAVAIAYERISECKESRDRFQRIVSGYEKNPNYITLELDDEVKALTDAGVSFKFGSELGRDVTVDGLKSAGYEAVFVGSGAGLPMFMNIPGESLVGVMSANEYLTRTNLMKAYDENADTPVIKSKAVAVVGGGNVAMDAARCAMRLGAEHVYVVYRRGEAEMPARKEEIHHAKEEEIEFKLLCNPTRVVADENGKVTAVAPGKATITAIGLDGQTKTFDARQGINYTAGPLTAKSDGKWDKPNSNRNMCGYLPNTGLPTAEVAEGKMVIWTTVKDDASTIWNGICRGDITVYAMVVDAPAAE